MSSAKVAIIVLGVLSCGAAAGSARADMPVTAVNAVEREDAAMALLRFEEASVMLDSLQGAPAYMAGELGFRFEGTMKPELDRFRAVLRQGLKAREQTARLETEIAPYVPPDPGVLSEAEARITAQREAWQQAERAGEGAAFLKRLEAQYAARSDRKAIDRLADLRVAVELAEENAKALTVFVRIVQTVLLDGPEGLEKVPDGDWAKGVAQLYAVSGSADGHARVQLSRDLERNRQRLLLLGLDSDQVSRLVAFYQSADGRKWSGELTKAYRERMRAITSDIAIAYVDAVVTPRNE